MHARQRAPEHDADRPDVATGDRRRRRPTARATCTAACRPASRSPRERHVLSRPSLVSLRAIDAARRASSLAVPRDRSCARRRSRGPSPAPRSVTKMFARLEVAVDDAVLVRALERPRDRNHQLGELARRRLARRAPRESVLPSRYSSTMYGRPSCSPTSKIVTMFSCVQRAVARASTRKRCTKSGSSWSRNLIATLRPSFVSRREEHLAHAAARDLADQLEPADARARRQLERAAPFGVRLGRMHRERRARRQDLGRVRDVAAPRHRHGSGGVFALFRSAHSSTMLTRRDGARDVGGCLPRRCGTMVIA